jgi:uncharacterized metal-binding protein
VLQLEVKMEQYSADFSLDVQGVTGFCPTGDAYAQQQIAAGTTPVLSCEGPCIRGEIARLAATLITQEVPSLSRACHGEAFFVPHSTMASWVRGAEKILMIDGCFLKCHGRVLNAMVGQEKVVHVDALPLYNKYTNVFSMGDVPEDDQKAAARQVADHTIARLKREGVIPGDTA